jgi:hypothetical protein
MCWIQPYTRHHIVLCILLCLSSSCALCMVVSNTYCVVYFILFVFVLCLVYGGVQHILHNMCWTPPYTRHKTKTNKVKYTTQYVLDTTIHKAQDEDKQSKIHNTTLCMVVSNAYCVVYFTLFVFVLCLVYGGVQHILCCVFCFVCLRLVPCVWWCPTHIVLCIHNTICVGHHHTQGTRRRQTK